MFNLMNFEKEVRNELLDYLEYLHETGADLVKMLSEKFQIAYENLAELSSAKLKEIANYYDGLGLLW